LGAYEVLSLLGEGAQGIVYLARDKQGREVALKIDQGWGEDETALERFKREARLALTLTHPNLVQTYDAGVMDGRVYIACEVLTGGTLAKRIARDGRLSERGALNLMRYILKALGAIERAGLVHRDVKPENVLFSGLGVAKLSDLGLARPTNMIRSRCTRTGIIVGSPLYMSPEQIDEPKAIDVRSDIYSVGAVLYHCLTGEPPFMGADVVELLKKHLAEPPPDVRRISPEVSAAAASLVSAFLEKDRALRPKNPEAALALIDRIVRPDRLGPDTATQGRVAIPTLGPELAADATPLTVTGPGLSCLALELAAEKGRWTLFVYGGDELRFGRVWRDDDPFHVCLRLRPESGNELPNGKISRRQFAVRVKNGAAFALDYGSAGGTFLDGYALKHGTPVQFFDLSSKLSIARVLEIVARVVPVPPTEPPRSLPTMNQPSIVIERKTNGPDHAYALVPGRLGLALGPDPFATGAPPEVEIMSNSGALWVRGGGVPLDACRPLEPGLKLKFGGAEMKVRGIDAAMVLE
jgi:hypothetical protein